MKLLLSSIPLLILHYSLILAQFSTFNDGAYRTHNDFFNNKPLYKSDFTFTLKYNKKIPELYSVKSANPRIKMKIVSKAVWGIKDGNSFYINVKRIGLTNGYIKLKNPQIYSYFKGPLLTIQQKKDLNNMYYTFGTVGGVAKEISMKRDNKDKVHYVVNFNSGMVNLLTPGYMCLILEKDMELLKEFKNEPDKQSIEVLLKYLDLINNKSDAFPYRTKTTVPSPDNSSLKK